MDVAVEGDEPDGQERAEAGYETQPGRKHTQSWPLHEPRFTFHHS